MNLEDAVPVNQEGAVPIEQEGAVPVVYQEGAAPIQQEGAVPQGDGAARNDQSVVLYNGAVAHDDA